MTEAASKFRGRRILVTGAASGIGKATAEALMSQGAAVALIDRSAIDAPEGNVAVVADLTDPQQLATAVAQAAAALGGLDGVVNSAGVACGTPIDDLDIDEWSRVMAINLNAPYLVCRAALPFLRQARGASIVNVASATALLPSKLAGTAYAASKGGVLVFTKALAAELAPDIRVNAVCPGLVDTPLMAHVLHQDGGPPPAVTANYALGRAAQAEEVASAILYLLGADASFVNGIALPVDGGRTYH